MSQAGTDSTARALTPRSLFWALFWATIMVLALLYGYAQIKVARLALDKHDRVLVDGPLYKQLQLVLPEVFTDMQREFDAAVDDVEQLVSTHIDAAFEPVYAGIPAFLDFHYSVVGEYTELAAALSNRVGADLERILFTETDFERRRAQALAAISQGSDAILARLLDRFSRRLQDRLALADNEMAILSNVATLTIEDAAKRFGTGELLLKGAGAAVGAATVATMVTKTIGTKVTAKLAAKTAGKTAIKATGVGGGAAGGAVAGLLCGPAAWICAPVAAIAAGAAAWIATDKVVIEVDEYFNRATLESEIRAAIDDQRQKTKQQVADLYKQWLQAILEDNQTKLKGITTRELIEGGS